MSVHVNQSVLGLNPGCELDDENVTKIINAFRATCQEKDIVCTYDVELQAFQIECNPAQLKTYSVTLPNIVRDRLEAQDQPDEDDETFKDDLAIFGVDTARVQWIDEDEEAETDAVDLAAPANANPADERVRAAWAPSVESKAAATFLDVRIRPLLEEVGRRTGSTMHISAVNHEVIIFGPGQEPVDSALGLLKTLERHLNLLCKRVVGFMLDVTEPRKLQLRFSPLNAPVNQATRNAIIDLDLRSINDMFILRATDRGNQDVLPARRALIPSAVVKVAVPLPKNSTSTMWGDGYFMSRGDATKKPSSWAALSRSLERKDPEANRVQQWVAEGAGVYDSMVSSAAAPAAASGAASGAAPETPMPSTGTPSTLPAKPQFPAQPTRYSKKIGKTRRPVNLNTYVPETPLPKESEEKTNKKKKKKRKGADGNVSSKQSEPSTASKEEDHALRGPWSSKAAAAASPAPAQPSDVYGDELLEFLDALEVQDNATYASSKAARPSQESPPADQAQLVDFVASKDVSNNVTNNVSNDVSNEISKDFLEKSSRIFGPTPQAAPTSDPPPVRLPSPELKTEEEDGAAVPEATRDEPEDTHEQPPVLVTRHCASNEVEYDFQWPRFDEQAVPKKPHEAAEEFTNADQVYEVLGRMLELARSHNGEVALRIKLGKVLVRRLARQHTKAFAPGDWMEMFQDAFANLPTFTDMLFTAAAHADAILELQTAAGNPAFEPKPVLKRVIYEFGCVSCDGEEIIVEVDGETFAHSARRPIRTLGSAFIYCPERPWDAQLSLTGNVMASGCRASVDMLLENLYIAPKQRLASLATRIPSEELRVRSVRVKRQTQHLATRVLTTSETGRLALQITQVQDLIVQHHPHIPGALRAFATTPAEMVADPEGSRLWYAADIVSLSANEILKRNQDVGFAEEAKWTRIEEVIEVRDFRAMYRAAITVLAAIDGSGQQAPAEKESHGKVAASPPQLPAQQDNNKTKAAPSTTSEEKKEKKEKEKVAGKSHADIGTAAAQGGADAKSTKIPTEAGTRPASANPGADARLTKILNEAGARPATVQATVAAAAAAAVAASASLAARPKQTEGTSEYW